MTTYSDILHIAFVASNQNQKEVTINTGLAILEAAMNDQVSLSLASSNITLTTDQFTKAFHQVYSGHTVTRTVTIPATKRFFCVTNNGTAAITIHAQGSSGTDLSVAAGARVLVLSDGTDVRAVSSGVDALSDLSDTSGVSGASSGQYLGFSGGFWQPVDSVADVDFFAVGLMGSSTKVARHVFTRATRFIGNFDGSKGSADVASTGTATFAVKKNGSDVGTIVFTSASTATFTTSGGTSVDFGIGDVMTIVSPSSIDATLADVSVTLYGILI